MTWLLLALATALFYGLQGVWTKWITRTVSGAAACWAIFAFAFPLLAVYLAFQGLPSIEPRFWPALLTNVAINLVSFYLYVSAIQKGDLGLTYPLLALTPVFVLPVEWVLLGDLPGARGLGGIALVVLGVYLLNFSERRAGLFAPFAAVMRDPGARRMLAVALIWSVSAVVDKVATISSSPAFYGTLESGLIALAFVPLVMRRGEGFRAALSRSGPDRAVPQEGLSALCRAPRDAWAPTVARAGPVSAPSAHAAPSATTHARPRHGGQGPARHPHAPAPERPYPAAQGAAALRRAALKRAALKRPPLYLTLTIISLDYLTS